MFWWALILLLSLKGLAFDESIEEITTNDNTEVSVTEEVTENDPSPVTEAGLVNSSDVLSATVGSTGDPLQSSRPPRRRPRRFRGFYNDMRYRNPANNPYNPNSPYAFRGRPGQPPMTYNQQRYSDQYYDPYNQYYGYQGYAPVQPQQQTYYYHYYQPRVHTPQPPTQSHTPAEPIPDLYYVQKPDSPDGQYQYKRVSVLQDSYFEGRARRRPTRWPQQPYGGYYNYPYDPYDRRPPPPPPQQYYQPYQYPQQYSPNNYYRRGDRSKLRSGRPPVRPTFSPSWRLTLAPFTPSTPPLETQTSSDLKTEPSGD